MKRIVYKLHFWLSLPVGLVVSLIAFTGALLVFETEITELTHPNRYYVQPAGAQRLPVAELLEKVSAQLPDTVLVTSVALWADAHRTCRIGIDKPARTAVYANPYTGQLLEGYAGSHPFFGQVRQLHRWLLLQGENRALGKQVVGSATLALVVILLSGLLLWLPRSTKGLKKSLLIRLRSGGHAFWKDLHVVGGLYVGLLLVVMALTGLTWSFEWYRNGLYGLLGARTEAPSHPTGSRDTPRGDRPKQPTPPNYAAWEHALNQVLRTEPAYKIATVSKNEIVVTPNQTFGNSRATNRYAFDPTTGLLTQTTHYAQQPRANKARGWIYSIHTGSWGGWVVKSLYFLAALVGGCLPLTGYYLFIRKKLLKKKRQTAAPFALDSSTQTVS